MNILDLALAVVLLANVLLGLRLGLVRRLLVLIGLFLALGAAESLGTGVAKILIAMGPGLGSPSALAAAYLLLVLLVLILIEILSRMYSGVLRLFAVIGFDRAAGVAAGVVVGLFECGILLRVVDGLVLSGRGATQDPLGVGAVLRGSSLAPLLHGMVTATEHFFFTVLPPDMAVWLAQQIK